MQNLTVFYDPACGLCTRVKEWLAWQPAYVPLVLVAAGSGDARSIVPEAEEVADGELLVVSDEGEAWHGDHAWIMCLWALRRYRSIAYRLSSPVLRPLARQAFEVVSCQRGRISLIFGMQSEQEIARQLRRVPGPVCSIPSPVGRHDD